MLNKRHLGWMLLAVGLLAAGSCRQLDPGTGEIRFRVEAGWQSGTKAAMYDDGTVSSGSFGVAAYTHGTTTAYISATTVSYAAGAWSFDGGQRYWPASGTLDFHAWMPATRPSYITSPTYAAGNPGFTCSGLPLTTAGQASLSEYVYAFTPDRGKDGGAVPLSFNRPLAVVGFRMSGSPGVTLHSITVKDVYNNGVFTHASGTWTTTGSAGDLVFELDGTHYGESSAPVDVGTPLLVKPQTLGTQQIVVDYTLDGTAAPRTQKTFTVSIASWAAGTRYTYTLNLPDWLSVGSSGEPISWAQEPLASGPDISWTPEPAAGGETITWQ